MIEIDKSTMPHEIKGDIMKEAQWENNEKNRLAAEIRDKTVETKLETETVKTEEKPTTEIKEEVKPEFDITEFKEFEVNSKDDIKERLKEHNLTKKERDELKSQLESKEKEYQQFIEKSKENPFNDPDLYRLNHIKRESPTDYDFYKKVVMGGIDGFELIKTQFLKDNPKISPEKADTFLRDKYGLDQEYDETNPTDVKEKEINETSLLLETEKIKKEIYNKFNEIKVPEPTIIDEEKVKQESANRLATHRAGVRKQWSPIAEKIVSDFNTMPIHIQGEDNKIEEFMDYIIPTETKKELATQVLTYLTENDKPFNEDSLREAQVQVRLLYDLQNRAAINKAFGDKVRAMTNEEWQKITINPSALQSKSNTEKEKGKTNEAKYKDTQNTVFEKLGGKL